MQYFHTWRSTVDRSEEKKGLAVHPETCDLYFEIIQRYESVGFPEMANATVRIRVGLICRWPYGAVRL